MHPDAFALVSRAISDVLFWRLGREDRDGQEAEQLAQGVAYALTHGERPPVENRRWAAPE